MADVQVPDDPKWLLTVAEKRRQTAYVLLLAAAGLAVLGVFRIIANDYPSGVFTIALGLIAAGIGVWSLVSVDAGPNDMSPVDKTRLQVLVLGGLAGFTIAVFGVVLGWIWWKDILSWMQPGGAELANTGQTRTTTGLHALLPMPVALVGLGIMFASLLLARKSERSSAFMRRLVYGYNAVLTCLLLLMVLVVANVFAAVKLQKPLDFTTSTMFTLSDRSVNILKHLEKPVKVYVLLDRGGPFAEAIQTMLVNCREVNARIEVETISTNRNVNPETIEELQNKLPGLTLTSGLVIRYGPKDSKNVEYRLIKTDDLFGREGGRGPTQFDFKGEDALMTQLTSLMEGKQKPTLYFLQGHGELDLKDSNPRSLIGSGEFKKRLEDRNLTVKSLGMDVPDAKVPSDATMVVIAGPQNPLSEFALKALDEYMSKGGKLVVLLGPTPNRQRTEMIKTGLEPFLAKFNVVVGDDRVLSWPSKLPRMTDVLVEGNPQLREHPLVRPFRGPPFQLIGGTRAIQPRRPAPGAMSRFQADALLVCYLGLGPVWQESNLSTSPEQLFTNYRDNDRQALLQKAKKAGALPVAVGVAEMTGPPPSPHPFMQPPQPTEQKPRLIVVGNAAIASNLFTNARGAEIGYEFLASSMEWLRERPANIGIEPKKHQIYVLPASKTYWSMVLPPVVLILFGIVGLGTGVWLVRRR